MIIFFLPLRTTDHINHTFSLVQLLQVLFFPQLVVDHFFVPTVLVLEVFVPLLQLIFMFLFFLRILISLICGFTLELLILVVIACWGHPGLLFIPPS